MNTTIVDDSLFTEDFGKAFFKLSISLVVGFVGFSFAMITVWYVVFLVSAIEGNAQDGIPALLLSGVIFALGYGIIMSLASATLFFFLGILAALIGWKLKLLRWWTCLIGGTFLSISPLALIFTLGSIVRFLGGHFPDSREILETVAGFLGLGFCGGTGGLCFWVALRLLRFPNLDGPIYASQSAK